MANTTMNVRPPWKSNFFIIIKFCLYMSVLGPNSTKFIVKEDDDDEVGALVEGIDLNRMYFMRTKWGRKSLVYQGFIFTTNKRVELTNTVYWRCTFASSRKKPNCCGARCITRDNKLISFAGSHNHESELGRHIGQEMYTHFDINNP